MKLLAGAINSLLVFLLVFFLLLVFTLIFILVLVLIFSHQHNLLSSYSDCSVRIAYHLFIEYTSIVHHYFMSNGAKM